MKENILKMIRQRNGVDENDKSIDKEIMEMTPLQKLEDVCGWEFGYSSWATQLLEWAGDCGFKIEEDK